MKDVGLRFLIYFVLILGWIYLYVDHPALTSNATFVYQDF